MPAADRVLTLTWDHIHRDSRQLASMVRSRAPFKGILAVARGGLVPAALLAHELACPMVDTVCVSSYCDRLQGEMRMLKAPPDHKGQGWLVVDDLVDSGATFESIRALMPEAHFVTLYAKPHGAPRVDSFVTVVDQDVWIVFPWE